MNEDSSEDLGGGRKSGVSVPAPINLNLGTGGLGGLFSVRLGSSILNWLILIRLILKKFFLFF